MIIADKLMHGKFVKTTAIDAMFYFVLYLYFTFFSPYLDTLDWSEPMKGWFFALFSLASIVFSILVGTISDKLGRFKLIVFGIILEVIAISGYVFFTDPVVLFSLRILSALSFNAVVLSAQARINDVATDAERGKANGMFHSIISIGAMIAPLLGGFIADQYGFTNLFMVAGFCMLAILIGFLLFDMFFFDPKRHHYRERGKLSRRDFNPLKNIRDAIQFKEIRAIAFLGMLVNFSVPITALVIPYIVIGKLGLTNSHFAMVLFVLAFGHLLQYFFGYFSDNFGKGKSIYLGLSVVVLTLVALFFVHSFELLLLFMLIRSLGSALWNISAISYMSDLGEKYNIEGKVVGAYGSFARMSIAISYVISGAILVSLDQGIFLLYAGLIIIGLFAVARIILANPKKSHWED